MVTRSGTVASAVTRAVRAAQLTPADAAAVALARTYAAAVDAGDQAAGLRLLKVLDSLGLTPAGRAAPAKGGTPDADPQPVADSALARLRAEWGPSARQRRAAALHAVPD